MSVAKPSRGVSFLFVYLLWTSKENRPATAALAASGIISRYLGTEKLRLKFDNILLFKLSKQNTTFNKIVKNKTEGNGVKNK